MHSNGAEPAILDKIANARTRLLLDKPFLGALALRLQLTEAGEWCKSTAIDPGHLYYNPDFVATLTSDELQFVLCHEALHCALSHFTRRGSRIRHRWDLACDLAVNPVLVDEGLTPPPGILLFDEYRNMTAEEIYPLLDDNDMSETLDIHLHDDQNGRDDDPPDQTPPAQHQNREPHDTREHPGDTSATGTRQQPVALTPDQRVALQQQWHAHLSSARQQAMALGKLSAVMQRYLKHQNATPLPWREVLQRFLQQNAHTDYNWHRPSNRRPGPAIYPSLKSHHLEAAVAIDVSGSVDDASISMFIDEINHLKSRIPTELSILCFDSEIIDGFPLTCSPWDPVPLMNEVSGGGSTDFRPVFDWLRLCDRPPSVLIFLTDALGSFPAIEPDHPVLWLVRGNAAVPWGWRVSLD